jgi:hypothetical protein
MKVLMGIWLGSDPVSNEQQIQLGIATRASIRRCCAA